MRHIRFILWACLVFVLVLAPIIITGDMLAEDMGFRYAMTVFLRSAIYSFPVVFLSFFVYRFILEQLKERTSVQWSFTKRFLLMLCLGIFYFAFYFNSNSWDDSWSGHLEFLVFSLSVYAFLALIYELAFAIARKFGWE